MGITEQIYKNLRESIKKYIQGDFTETILKSLDEVFGQTHDVISLIEMVERVKTLETKSNESFGNRIKDLVFHTNINKSIENKITSVDDKLTKLMDDFYDGSREKKNISITIEDNNKEQEPDLESLKKELKIQEELKNEKVESQSNNNTTDLQIFSKEQDLVQCELCDKNMDIEQETPIELTRETEQVSEDFIMCEKCFDHNKKTLKEEGWKGEVFSESEISEEEETKPEYKENKKEEGEKEEVYYQEYKCKMCNYKCQNDNPDCSSCEKNNCMYAVTENERDEDEKNDEEVEVEEEVVEEEVVEEEVVEEEVVEEEVVEEEVVEEEEEEEEELEVEEFTHKGKRYYLVGTKEDGEVYSVGDDEDLGELQGSYVMFINH